MKKKLMFLIALVLLLVSGYFIFISATQPTQQFNKIYLNPFYTENMVLNTNYNYTITVNPPDGITKVNSAIISWNAQINGQSQNFSIKVNNQFCNTKYYYIATAFSTTGNAQFSFDCSNVINQSGTYNVTFRSAVNTGAVSGWLDLVYMNNPKGDLELSGTEYSPNDPATIFVQLKDSQGLAVGNGSCYLDMWSPANGSNVHPNILQDAPMLKALGNDGIYYYDLIAPSQLGVYMLSARCAYAFNWIWVYRQTENIFFPVLKNQSGTWTGNETVLNSNEDSAYSRCDATAVIPCVANFTFDITGYIGSLPNVTSINLYYAGQGDIAGKLVTLSYWNGTTFVNLPNTLTIVNTGASATTLGVTDQYVTNTIPISAMINGTVKIRYSTPTGLARYYHNWLALAFLTATGTIQDVKGSSEMHITDIANASLNALLNNTQVAQNIWNYSNRSLTFYNNTQQVDMTNYTKITNDVANATWNYLNRSLTNFNFDVSPYVWNNTNRTLSSFNFTVNATINNSAVADVVWNYNGTISTNILNQFASYFWSWAGSISDNIKTLLAVATWNNPTRTLTDFNITVNATINNTELVNQIWGANNQTDLTNYTYIQNLISQYGNNDNTNYTLMQDLITNYGNLNSTNYTAIQNLITQYGNTDNANYTLIQYLVSQYGNNDNTNYTLMTDLITQYGNYDMVNYTLVGEVVANNVWNYNGTVNNNVLSQFGSFVWSWTGNISSVITDAFAISNWNSTTRTLTDFNNFNITVNATINNTELVNQIWGANNQTDLTNYTLMQELITQYGNNQNQTDLTNYTAIQNLITQYGNTDSTNYTLIQYLISQYGNYDSTNYTLMEEIVAQYANNETVNYTQIQNLITQFGNNDVSNYTLIQDLITQYGNNQTDMTNYSLMTDLMMQFANNDSTNYSAIQNLIIQYGNTDTANYTLIQYLVSQYGNNDNTNYSLMTDLITQFGNNDMVNYTLVEDIVNQYSANYTLIQNLITQYGNNQNQTDLTNYTLMQDLITQFGNNAQNQTDLTNYTAIQNLITQYGNTDTANYTLMQYIVSQYGNNDNTNYTLMQDLINQYGNTDNVNYTLVQDLITQYGNNQNQTDLTNYSKIGEFVWNWTSRELTGLNLTVNATINTTNLINQIWSWSNRSLTFYADMTNYTKVNVGVWTYNNRTLFFLYGNGTGGSVNPPSGNLPLTNIEIVLPDPFYFDTPYTIYYDPVDVKGATVDVTNVNMKILENITYTLTTPTIMTDGRYKQDLTIPLQDITSVTLSVNMTQGFVLTNQKSFITPEEKRGGITGFVTMDGTTKRNLLYLLFVFLFLLFLFIIVAVVSKSRKQKANGGFYRY